MRNNVVSCANRTVKLNVLHPCVDTLEEKLQAFELQHMVQNILLRGSKKWVLIFYQHNLRHGNFFTAKQQIRDSCERYKNHGKSSSLYNVKIKSSQRFAAIRLAFFNWKASIQSTNSQCKFNLISSLLNWYEGGIESFCSNRIFSAKVLPRCLTRVTENCKHNKIR